MGCTYSINAYFDIKDEEGFCRAISMAVTDLHAVKTMDFTAFIAFDIKDAIRMATGDPYASCDPRTGLWSAAVTAGYGWSEKMYYIFERALAFCSDAEVECSSWEDAGYSWRLKSNDGVVKEVM